jgi:hypothetical protein
LPPHNATRSQTATLSVSTIALVQA